MPRPDAFQHQAIKDLVWLLTTPKLGHCTAECWQIPTPDWDTLVQLDRNPSQVDTWFANKQRQLLGHYHEQLWLFYFHQHPDVELLAHNKRIQGKHRTLGEFDVLLKDRRDGLVWHLELAIKFYLGTTSGWGPPNHWSHWLGVACQDSMEHKWRRMMHQQLTLGQQPEVRHILKTQRENALLPDRASALTRGCLFYPDPSGGRHLPDPEAMNPNHLRGRWLPLNQWLARYKRDDRPQWRICLKPYWLAQPNSITWLSGTEVSRQLVQTLQQQNHPTEPLKHHKKPQQGTEGLLLEHRSGERLFVVADNWPGYIPLPWYYPR